MAKSNLTLTVGITTCYGDNSIVQTVRSIRSQKGINKFRFIIIADRVPVNDYIKTQLKKHKVELIENKLESGQVKKQKQILDLTKSDILILTQDDVLYRPYTFKKILKAFEENSKLTMLSVRNQHLEPISLFEDVINVGTRIANRIAKDWNKGDNYIANVGRCMAFRVNFLKKHFRVPESVATTDAYYFYSNKKAGGKFKYLQNTAVYFRNPQNITEHLRKSSRFQYSEMEMSTFFGDLSNEYKIPKTIILKAVFIEFAKAPIKTILYFLINIYTRINRLQPNKVLNPIWEVDVSTKQI